jgi:hypothetical protein
MATVPSRTRAVPGMFHVLWNLSKMVLRAFSGVGLLQMALELGSTYLDQFERSANYRATMRVLSAIWVALMSTLPRDDQAGADDDERREQLQVLHLLCDTVGRLVIAHHAARVGDHRLFYAAVCALAPIAPASGSYKYAAMLARWTYAIQGAATEAAEHVRAQLAERPGARLTVGGGLLHYDEIMEETIRFLKGVTDQRHLRDEHKLASHFAHAQPRHQWMAEFFAAVRGDHVARTTTAAATRRSADLRHLVETLATTLASGRPSDAPLFATAPYLHDAKRRAKLLGAFAVGAERLVTQVRQLVTRTEPMNSTGATAKNVPEFFSVAAVRVSRGKNDTAHDVSARALAKAAAAFIAADLPRAEVEAEKTAVVAAMLRAAAGPYPHTLAQVDGAKTPSTQATTMPVMAALASTATTTTAAAAPAVAATMVVAAADTHAIDGLQLLMAEADGMAVRTAAWLAQRLVERVLATIPAAARHVYLVFPRPGLLPSPWTAPPPALASAQTARRRTRRDGNTVAARTFVAAMIGADARLRREVVHDLVPLLLGAQWPHDLEVTVDAESEHDPAAVPVTVLGGRVRARPDLRHTVGESAGAAWLLLRAGGRGGVVHTSDAQSVDWALHVAMADRTHAYWLCYTGARTHTVDVGELLAALEAGTAGAGECRLPEDWTAEQRVHSVLVAKAMAGNAWHEALATVTAGTVLRYYFEHAATVGPLWDTDADAVCTVAAHRLVLRVFFEASGLRKEGLAMPYPDHASDAVLEQAHASLAGQLLRKYTHRPGRPIGYGLLPSSRAVRLSIARASTYLRYVLMGVRTPRTRFVGWVARDSGYRIVDGVLRLHWDDDEDGAPVEGPEPRARTTASSATATSAARTRTRHGPTGNDTPATARATKRTAPLSARPSPVSALQRPRLEPNEITP